MLWRDALVMYDRTSNSLWTQVTGEAVAGPMKGEKLKELPSELTTWGDWKRRHPKTLVLRKPPLTGSRYAGYHQQVERIGVLGTENPDPRLGGKVLVAGIEIDGAFSAIPIDDLRASRIRNEVVGESPVLIAALGDGQTVHAWHRTVGGETLTFRLVERDGGRVVLRDTNTGSVWDWESGQAIEGAHEGHSLERVEAMPIYWAIWAKFHPGTALIGKK